MKVGDVMYTASADGNYSKYTVTKVDFIRSFIFFKHHYFEVKIDSDRHIRKFRSLGLYEKGLQLANKFFSTDQLLEVNERFIKEDQYLRGLYRE